MIYFAKETDKSEAIQQTAGIKARDDLEMIFRNMGIRQLDIPSFELQREEMNGLDKLKSHFAVVRTWEKSITSLQQGDTLIIQFPIIEHTILISKVFKQLKKKGVSIILIIHDLELLRRGRKNTPIVSRIRINAEEMQCLKKSDYIIGHNDRMNDHLLSLGIEREKLISLCIFDYLIAGDKELNAGRLSLEKPVIIGGNLRPHKAGYVYKLPKNCSFNLYGVGYDRESEDGISYHGSFPPDELPYVMEGSFGLVWDGMSAESCEGTYGEYLKINNPHKTSLYVASEIPVIIWDKAALAEYVRKTGVGITVSSLNDIAGIISALSKEDYNTMIENVKKEGRKLRNGFYTRNALKKCGRIFMDYDI